MRKNTENRGLVIAQIIAGVVPLAFVLFGNIKLAHGVYALALSALIIFVCRDFVRKLKGLDSAIFREMDVGAMHANPELLVRFAASIATVLLSIGIYVSIRVLTESEIAAAGLVVVLGGAYLAYSAVAPAADRLGRVINRWVVWLLIVVYLLSAVYSGALI
jgi:hypothetical protein